MKIKTVTVKIKAGFVQHCRTSHSIINDDEMLPEVTSYVHESVNMLDYLYRN